MPASGSGSSPRTRGSLGLCRCTHHASSLQLGRWPPAGRRGRRLPVPAFRGRLPSPRRSRSRGQGRDDVLFRRVRGVQPSVVEQKERSKGSPDIDSRRFKTPLEFVSKTCIQLFNVLIFDLIPSF